MSAKNTASAKMHFLLRRIQCFFPAGDVWPDIFVCLTQQHLWTVAFSPVWHILVRNTTRTRARSNSAVTCSSLSSNSAVIWQYPGSSARSHFYCQCCYDCTHNTHTHKHTHTHTHTLLFGTVIGPPSHPATQHGQASIRTNMHQFNKLLRAVPPRCKSPLQGMS